MANIKGNITNPITLNGKVVSEIEVRTDFTPTLNVSYLANSLSPSLFTVNNAYFLDDLSNVRDLIFKSVPVTLGNSALKDSSPNKLCLFNYEVDGDGNLVDMDIFANIPMQYIDGGKTYTQYGAISEKKNYLGWEPLSNEDKYSHIERTDVYGFDYPQFTPRGTRKIPVTESADTLCGPVTYVENEYTYDRLNYNWFFGNNAGINFNTIKSGATPVTITGSVVSQEGCSSISDQEGNLLFYTDGENVYTKLNTIMLNGTGLSSSGTSTQSSIIVPQPDSNNYYIFTTDFEGNPDGFEYSIVDMTLQDGLGQVTTKNIKLINNPITEKVTSCNHANDEDYWVITHTSGDSRYYAYKLSSSGLVAPVISNIGQVHNSSRGYMKTSLNGDKLISLLYDENIIQILDFDASGGTLSNEIVLTGLTFSNGPYGLEYSSDSTKFYVSDGASQTIKQFDLSYTSSTEMVENVIEVASITDSSLGALQMGPDEKIYVADNLKNHLHVIHRPNGLGVQCNFQERGFYLTGVTSGITSTWGLPNTVTTKDLSCDRYIYVSERDRTPFEFDLIMNDVSNVIQPNMLNFTAEIYPFNHNTGAFDVESLFNQSFTYDRFSGESGTTLSIPVSGVSEGEFIIKGYYEYPIKTLLQKQLGFRRNSINNYKRGTEYNIYNPETDWYFLNIYEADKPTFSNTDVTPVSTISNLKVVSTFTNSGDTIFYYNSQSDPIVTYNGVVLAKDIEYSAITTGTTPYVLFNTPTLADQMVTLAYVEEGNTNELIADTYTVIAPIASGKTNEQTSEDKLYYNTDRANFEFYLEIQPYGDVIFTLNGTPLSNNIEYLRSSSDFRRIIILVDIKPGDLIQVFYNPLTGVFGPLQTNEPTLSWSIVNAPTLGQSGLFTVQITNVTDEDYENVQYFDSVPYVIGQRTYSVTMNLSNAVAGDKLMYRIKNEKFYTPIVGQIITSVAYSDSIPIEIVTNKGNIY